MLGKFTQETYRTTMSCSFLSIVGGICGGVDRTSSSTFVTPLTQCKKDIKKSLKFSGVEKEVELILAGCGCLLEMTICPAHRARIGIGWRRTSNFLHHPGSCFGSLQGAEESNRTGKRNKFIPIQKDIRTFKTAHPCGLR